MLFKQDFPTYVIREFAGYLLDIPITKQHCLYRRWYLFIRFSSITMIVIDKYIWFSFSQLVGSCIHKSTLKSIVGTVMLLVKF